LTLHADPRRVLVVGWGAGITVGAFTTDARVERIDVVELERAVLDAAPLFAEHIHHAHRDPRVRVRIDDGRNYVAHAGETYDIIVQDPPDCWITGPSFLFTREHLERVRARLRPGGIFVQWVSMQVIDDAARRTLLKTYADAFPHLSVWEANWPAETILVASLEPMALRWDRWETRCAQPGVRADLDRISRADPARFAASRVGELPRGAFQDAPPNTDDLPLLEFRQGPWLVDRADRTDAHDWLIRQRGEPDGNAVEGVPPDRLAGFLVDLAAALEARRDSPAALAVHAERAKRFPDDPHPWAEQARLWIESGRPESAAACAQQAVRLRPDHPAGNYLLGVARSFLGRHEESLAPLRQAIASGQADPLAHLVLGRALARLRRPAEARAAFEAFLAQAPEDPDGLAELAACWEQEGDRARALAAATRALAVERRPEARAHLERWIARLGGK